MAKVSIVVPVYNAERTIERCLDSLVKQSFGNYEIIIVDNSSNDGSFGLIDEFIRAHPKKKIKLMREEKKGPSAARNRGIQATSGEIIAFTDSDCMPDKNWLKEIKEAFCNSKIGAVAGRIVGYKPESTLDKFHTMFTLRGLLQPQIFTEFMLVRGGFPTANLAVRKDVFDLVRGFDESMKIYSEDYDLCARIYQTGFSIQYITSAVVYHKHRNLLRSTWWQSFGFGTGHAALLKKHFKQLVIIDIPKYQYLSRKWPICMWLDLTGADKKMLGLILLSIVWWPVSFLLIFYFLFLYKDIGSRLRQTGLSAGFVEKWQLVFLLFFKSAALTAGRVIGSIRNWVLCF